MSENGPKGFMRRHKLSLLICAFLIMMLAPVLLHVAALSSSTFLVGLGFLIMSLGMVLAMGVS